MPRHTRTFSFPTQPAYAPAPSSSDADLDAEALLPRASFSTNTSHHDEKHSTSNNNDDYTHTSPASRPRRRWLPPLLLILSHTALFLVGLLSGTHIPASASTLARQTTRFLFPGSPVLATAPAPLAYAPVVYNGSFFHETAYRGDASPATDEAWGKLGVDYRAARVRDEDGAAAGLGADHVRVREEHGGGWVANVEGLHHLHCLNLLRQALPWNYEYYEKLGKGAFKNEKKIVKAHVTHCLDILRQQLMCTADIGVLGQVWWGTPEAPKPFVDFNTRHTCRDFDAVRRWAEERQLPEDPPADFLEKPRGRVVAEIP